MQHIMSEETKTAFPQNNPLSDTETEPYLNNAQRIKKARPSDS